MSNVPRNQHQHRARPIPGEPGHVVVAGGTGFIGSHLIPALSAAGHRVSILSRRAGPGRPSGGGNGSVQTVPWDPLAPGPWQETLRGAVAVINLCGASLAGGRWTESRKRTLLESRTVPSQALVDACNALDDPPAVLLQASGVNYYPTGEEEHDEHGHQGTDFLARLASAWEAPLQDTDVRTVSLRFGVVLDSSGGALPQMLLPFRLLVGGPVAGGRQWMSWIHVRDAVAAIRFVMESPMIDAVNVTAPNPVRNAEFAGSAGRAMRRPALLPMPGFLLYAALGEQATLVCDGVRAAPAKLDAAGFEFQFPKIEQALQDLLG
jgi:uncharacterized protein